MIAPAGEMFGRRVWRTNAGLEVPALQTLGRQQRIGEQLAQTAPEPEPRGTPKPCLRPVQNIARQSARCDLLEHVLPTAVPDLERGRQRDANVDHLVVEQRHARLDRVRHAHSIHFRQHVLGQVRFGVEAHHLARPRKGGVALEAPRRARFGIQPRAAAPNVRRQQRLLFVGAEEANRIKIAASLVTRDVPQEILAACAVWQARCGDRRGAANARCAEAVERRRRVDGAGSGRTRRTARRRRRPTARP